MTSIYAGIRKNILFRDLLVLLVLPCSFWLITNGTVNPHYHIDPHGMLISHAHPFKPDGKSHSPIQPHKHSESQYLIFSLISGIKTFLVLFILLTIAALPAPSKVYLPPDRPVPFNPALVSGKLRAPPSA